MQMTLAALSLDMDDPADAHSGRFNISQGSSDSSSQELYIPLVLPFRELDFLHGYPFPRHTSSKCDRQLRRCPLFIISLHYIPGDVECP